MVTQDIQSDADAGTVTLNINGTFARAELMQLLAVLGAESAKLAPAMPESPAGSIAAPVYRHWGNLVSPDDEDGGLLLSIYHPGFGWVTNRTPASAAADLASRLSTHVTGRLLQIERGMQVIRERGVAAVAAQLAAATAPAEEVGACVH